jgi:uncharacterized protein (TIGR03083 family)
VTVHPALQTSIDAWTHSIEAISALVTPLSEREWSTATDLPGWSVRDIVSHIIGLENEMLGDPRPIHSLPRDLFHVTSEHQRYMEVQVDVRRCHTAPEMTAELEYTIIRRARQMRNEKRAPDATVRAANRERSLADALEVRAFDVWVHEQDLRRALGNPGNLDSPGSLVVRDILLSALPKLVAKDAGAPAGSAVVFDVSGPVEFMRTVRVDAQGRGTIDGSVSLGPAVTIATDWETYLRLATGRVRPGGVADRLKVEGDQGLADAILGNFSITS